MSSEVNQVSNHPKPSTSSSPSQVGRLRPGYLSAEALRNEVRLGQTGSFRALIEQYVATGAVEIYAPEARSRVPGNLGNFFRFITQVEAIDSLDEIRPSTVTRFLRAEQDRGIQNRIIIGQLSQFFRWLITEGRLDRGNPVVPSMHRQILGGYGEISGREGTREDHE